MIYQKYIKTKMSTIYHFITIQDSSQGSYFFMDEKHIDPVTIEWIKKTAKVPCTKSTADMYPEDEVDYVPLPDEHIIAAGDSSNTSEVCMEGVKKVIVVMSSLQYD